MRIGVLTGGGDCPGLNAAIRAIVRCATRDGATVLGIRNGYRGLVENDIEELSRDKVIGILPRGGTILGTSRFNPLKDESSLSALKENFASRQMDALVVVGGEGSLSAAHGLWRQHQVKLVGIATTIDNDISGADFTFGVDAVVTMITESIERLHSTPQ